MEKLIDDVTCLEWLLIDYEHDNRNPDTRKYIRNIRETINTWESDNIKRFITSKMTPGDFLYEMYDMYNDRYDTTQAFQAVAFENNEIVGTALIAINSNDIKRSLNTFSLPNNLKVLYLIVNPQYQNTGIGTRMIKSVTNNQKFFSNNSKISGISVEIHEENIPSTKVFIKNKFSIYKPATTQDKYSQYFFTEKTINTIDIK